MGKKSKSNVRNVRGMENNHSMDDEQYVNDKSASGSMGSEKKPFDDVDPARRKGSNDVDQENYASVSLHSLRKTPKKKRKKMGHPIIVEDTAGEFPTVPLPLPLRHRVTLSPAAESVSLDTFNLDEKKNRKKTTKRARVTTVRCTKPSPEVAKSCEKSCSFDDREESMELENSQILSNSKEISLPLAPEESSRIEEHEIADSHFREHEKSEPSTEVNEQTDIGQQPRFYSFRNRVLVIMETDCKFCFHGKLQIRVLYGAVRIYGYSCNSARTKLPLSIYSPRAYSPVAIEAMDSEIIDKNISKIWETLENECDDRKLAKRLQSDVNAADEGWAILMLENFDNQLTTFLATNFPHHLFPRIDDPSNHSWRDMRRAEIVLQANLRFDNAHPRIVIDSRGIDDVADAIAYDWETKKNSRTIVAGGKSVGKSTMARYLVNKFLSTCESVIFLDLDPGQAEFTPAGCISLTIVEEPLLGPNFTHLRTPHFQLYLGSSDVTRCLTRYVDGIGKLVDHLNNDASLSSNRPLVVNTMGYCKGIGWDIMSYVVKIVSPTDVVQILSRRTKNNFDDTLSRQVIDRQSLDWMSWRKDASEMSKPTRHRLHVIYSEAETAVGPAESWNLEAHQQRDLSMISYLSEIVKINEPTISQVRGLSSSINATPPYAIPFAAMSVSLAGAFIPQVLSVMNGNIVALCGVDTESTEKSNSDESATTSYPRVLLRPPLSTFYGFGILRGVDMEKEQLFLNTPLPTSHMKHVNCLVGSTNLPRSLLRLNHHGAPYTGTEYDLPTSRGPRRGYFRARYQVDT